jgi:uncharacterized membrane protein YcjF (UPF0283 family)
VTTIGTSGTGIGPEPKNEVVVPNPAAHKPGEGIKENNAAVPGSPEDYGGKANPAYETYVQHRRYLGFAVGGFAILFVLSLGVWSLYSLHNLLAPTNDVQLRFVIALFVVHAIITVALVYFCYQLLRAAERMLLPYWWASEKVEVAKVLLGIEDPVSTSTKVLQQASEVVKATKELTK